MAEVDSGLLVSAAAMHQTVRFLRDGGFDHAADDGAAAAVG